MIHEATKRIQTMLEQEGLKFQVLEKEEISWVEVQFGTEQFTLEINFISHDEDPDVSVRVHNLAKGAADKRDVLIRVCNDLNCRFRYVKFSVNSSNNVYMEYDFPLNTPMEAVGEVARECISRFLSISKKAYPELMKALWA